MHEQRFGDIVLRPFVVERDAAWLLDSVGRIWRGAGDAVIEAEFGPIGGRPWQVWLAEDVLAYLQADDVRGFIAEIDGTRVGFCSYAIDTARKRGTVGYNGVLPVQQGRGIGSTMLEFVLNNLRKAGMAHAVVLVADNEEHTPARRNYEKHGFHRFAGYHHLVQQL